MQYTIVALAALAALPSTFAQTFTDCNPLEKSCPNDVGLATANHNSDWTKGGKPEGWHLLEGTSLSYTPQGAQFSIAKVGQAPTIESDFHILFGILEVRMQAAPGQGIVSSIVFESADLDEIDWEFIGSDPASAQSNYFGKGNTTSYDRVAYLPVSPPPQNAMHTYTVDWSPERIIFSINGEARRTIRYADANGGANYPQTPMKIKLGNWAGGAPNSPKGTVEWSGGYTDYNAGPFNMVVESVKITNANPAKEYVWTDRSGSYQSIKLIGGNTETVGGAAVPAPSPEKPTTTAPATTREATPVQKAPETTEQSTTNNNRTSAPVTIIQTSTASNNTLTTSASTTTRAATTSASTGALTTTTGPAAPTQTGAASSTSAMSSLALLITLGVASWML